MYGNTFFVVAFHLVVQFTTVTTINVGKHEYIELWFFRCKCDLLILLQPVQQTYADSGFCLVGDIGAGIDFHDLAL